MATTEITGAGHDSELSLKTSILQELGKMAAELADQNADAIELLQRRSGLMGRLTYLGIRIDTWYAETAAKITGEDPKIPEWRWKIKMQNTIEGRLYQIRKNVSETLRLQCDHLEAQLIEQQSERKMGGRHT